MLSERDEPQSPVPVYLRKENSLPATNKVIVRVGSNTYINYQNRLVHVTDVSAQPLTNEIL